MKLFFEGNIILIMSTLTAQVYFHINFNIYNHFDLHFPEYLLEYYCHVELS